LRILRELHRQLSLSPQDVLGAHCYRLEEFLLDFDPHQEYPYEYIYFRVTGFRPTEDFRRNYEGSRLLPELTRMLEDLSRRAPRRTESTEDEVLTMEETAEEAGVAVRTVHRWRRRGLVCRSYRWPDGEVRRGVRRRALETFMAAHPELSRNARSFSRMDRSEERRAMERAREYAGRGLGVTETARRVADELGRATETVRRAIRAHDEDHPSEAVFTPEQAPEAHPSEVLDRYRRGESAEDLADYYDLSTQSIYRLVNSARAEHLLAEPPAAIQDPEFDEVADDDEVLDEPFREARRLLAHAPDQGRRRDLVRWWDSHLEPEQERSLFRGYNFLKARALRLLEEVNPRRYVSTRLLDTVERYLQRARKLRDELVTAYTPLAEHVAWQHAGRQAEAGDLVALARQELPGLVDSFDYRGKGRFASHATLELLKRLATSAAE
jgi:hypothetical protein